MKKVVLPEGEDERVQLAARTLVEEAIAHPVLVAKATDAMADIGPADGYTLLAPDGTSLEALAAAARAAGKEFAVSPTLAQGAALVRDGEADAIVAGAVSSTADVIKTYLKTIGMAEGCTRVSSCFLMEKGTERYLFADCGVSPTPTPEERAETAYLCNAFASIVGIKPKIAFLSFASHDSARHEMVATTAEAVAISKERWPELIVDGPLQVDSAIIPSIARRKVPESDIAGEANVLLFPDLNSGNIAYKLVERLGGFSATGPLLLGFAKPAHDLSRGCNVEDIVKAAKIAVAQCQ